MPQGTLEVVLVNAKGLENTDFLCTFVDSMCLNSFEIKSRMLCVSCFD